MVGAMLLASALLFGALAGAVVVHRLDTTPTASSEKDQGDQAGDSGHAKTKVKHANNGHHAKPKTIESEDKDA
jgi:uncharacterized membrane protein